MTGDETARTDLTSTHCAVSASCFHVVCMCAFWTCLCSLRFLNSVSSFFLHNVHVQWLFPVLTLDHCFRTLHDYCLLKPVKVLKSRGLEHHRVKCRILDLEVFLPRDMAISTWCGPITQNREILHGFAKYHVIYLKISLKP